LLCLPPPSPGLQAWLLQLGRAAMQPSRAGACRAAHVQMWCAAPGQGTRRGLTDAGVLRQPEGLLARRQEKRRAWEVGPEVESARQTAPGALNAAGPAAGGKRPMEELRAGTGQRAAAGALETWAVGLGCRMGDAQAPLVLGFTKEGLGSFTGGYRAGASRAAAAGRRRAQGGPMAAPQVLRRPALRERSGSMFLRGRPRGVKEGSGQPLARRGRGMGPWRPPAGATRGPWPLTCPTTDRPPPPSPAPRPTGSAGRPQTRRRG
jgi:hypothetical protein